MLCVRIFPAKNKSTGPVNHRKWAFGALPGVIAWCVEGSHEKLKQGLIF